MRLKSDALRGACVLPATLLALVLALVAALPAGAADRDGDGLDDSFESKWGVTSPDKADTDGDGVIDAAEDNDGDKLGNRGEWRFGTDPGTRDSDGDGRSDGREDDDRDGRSNAAEQDQRPVPAGLRPSLADAAGDVSPYKNGCQTTHGSAEVTTCRFGPASSKTDVVLMGDSHAMMITEPIKTVAEENGWRLTTLIKKACPPVLGIHNRAQRWVDDGATCRKWRRNVLDWLDADPPDHILLAHSDSYLIGTFKGTPIKGAALPKAWHAGMKRTLAAMPPTSKVLLLGDIPRNADNPAGCLRHHPRNISKCVTPREPLARRSIENALRRAAEAKGATFRSLYGKACSYDPCPVIQGDVLLYRDRGHYTATFARQLTPAFRRMLGNIIASPASRPR